jgi:iron(III) transport system permease protein
MSKRLFSLLVIVPVSIAVLLPVLFMLADTFRQNSHFDFSTYQVLFQSSTVHSFSNSLLLSLSVAAMSTGAGVILGLILSKTKLPFASLFIVLLTIPLLIPPYMLALGWYELLGREGYWGELLFGFPGTFWVLFSIYLPIPMLLTILFLRQVNPRFEEAARLMTGWYGVLRYITLPLIFPAILLSFLLVFILTFGEQSVANFLRFDVFALESFTYFSAFYDFKTATVLAVPMIAMAFIVLLAEQFLARKHLFRFNSAHKVAKISLGIYTWPLFFLMLLVIFIIVILPFSSILMQAADWQTIQEAFEKAKAPMLRSYLYAITGATLLMCFGFAGGYLIEEKIRGYRLYDALLIFLFALPAAVIGIALILFWNHSYTNFIYTTPLIILFGYTGKYLVLSTKISQNRLSQIPHSQIEVAQMAGANWFQVLRYILMPLSKKALLTMWLIGFIFSLRETTITMLVYPPGYETLPVYTLTQMANGDPKIIAALSLLMIAMILLPLLFIAILKKVQHDRTS